ncbi:MAG TPA: hypothetical protein VIP11_03255 [Gemmatimonadaceae bacterium]
MARQLWRGALIGVGVGSIFIVVGLLRAGLFLLTGGRLSALSANDARIAVFYLGGFGLAGALVGVLLPRARTAVRIYAAFALAGMVVVIAIMAAAKGGLTSHDRLDWFLFMSTGAVFGCAAAYGLSKRL